LLYSQFTIDNSLSIAIGITIDPLTIHEKYIYRCIELAGLGLGSVAPNPMVGALLVCDDRIIGEGYHEKYGEPHAEPNCIASVKEAEKQLIPQSTLYVSLEPCSHHGKTPPCADLIISHKIPKVVIGCRDPFPEVNGKGIERLRAAGIDVEVGVFERQCKDLNKRFFTFHIYHRPFIILKWAQSLNNKIAALPGGAARSYITNGFTNRLVHKWRSEEAAILVGTNTALADDPELTTRLWKGNNPTRMVVDLKLKLPSSLKIFNDKAKTIVFNTIKHEETNNILHYQVTEDVSLVHQIVNALYQLKVQTVIVEGGARLLQSFIEEGMWDEARVITNEELIIDNGLNAPSLSNQKLLGSQKIFSDQVKIYENYLTRSLAG
jgi:diaminohydroxyphosphoribosylaminopyrimidine deaminase/5-amino-6-(5-phosphoribosylamino)uracil reductase